MKVLHYINCSFYALAVIPYITIYCVMYGMYAQFLLGVYQVILALVLFTFFKKFNNEIKKHLRNYGILTLGILSLIFLISKTYQSGNDPILVVFVFIIPMLIASYFVYITYLIQKK